ncbi:MAG TPA: OadG family protein [Defluviitoga sp.]|nr:OadG family protein [Defluviitoga sp.]HOP23788.1 OadG family protein [Defluviitoga sp.]HPZ28465.1 OadG family protein [Defluviitoga sp.]HQD62801.1 OadG family protein [Defluviitoga sp.]
MADVWILTGIGILIVFSILIILYFVIWLFQFLFRSRGKGKKQKNMPVKESVEPMKLKMLKNKELDLTEEELIAVVAAVSMYYVGKQFEIKSVTRADLLKNKVQKDKPIKSVKTKWQKHNPSVSWNPKRKKRWR